MRIKVVGQAGFSGAQVNVPSTELEELEKLISGSELPGSIPKDYNALSFFKMTLLQTGHNLSDTSIADALKRYLIFMRFCGFSLEGSKLDFTTLCRFRKRFVNSGLLMPLLSIVNQSREQQGLKTVSGKYVSCDAALIQSARRLKNA